MYRTAMLAAFVAAIGFVSPAIADDAHMKKGGAQAATHAAGEMSEGQVRKVDKEAGKLTLRHGEIKNLEMPPMTMVFRAQDPAMLDRVKPGDKIRFTAEQKAGALVITRIELAK